MDLAADQCVEGWKKFPKYYQYVERYTDGVNAFIEQLKPKEYPIEYKMLNASPDPWTPKKTALFAKAMALDLCYRNEDIQASNTLNFWGESDFSFLYPAYNPKQTPIIPTKGEIFGEGETHNFPVGSHLYPIVIEKDIPDEGIGSNNWAVSGAKSTTGKPILANDPHLRLTLPAIWFEMHIQTPEMEAYGVSLPGLPNVIIGFNRNIAWGITNGGHDVLDWYRIEWADETKSAYWLDNEVVDVERKIEEFYMPNGKIFYDTVTYTHWGPLTYEKRDDEIADLALHWIAVQEPVSAEIATFMELNKAKDYAEYRQAIISFISPISNLIFASNQGDIALTVAGKLPLKKEMQGRFIQDGNKSSNGWDGFIPFNEMPHILNPNQQYIVSANQHSTNPDYPYYYNGSFSDYRGRYLNRKMEEKHNFNLEDMKLLQNDNYSLLAEEGLSALIAHLKEEELGSEQRDLLMDLKGWDYRYEAESQMPTFFELWLDAFQKTLFDELGDQKNIMYPEYWKLIEMLESDSTLTYFDIIKTDKKESKKEVVTLSFSRAYKKFDSLEKKSWKLSKGTIIEHIANIPGFDSGVLEVGGSRYAPNAISERNGPSWRQIVALGEEPSALGILPGGQSGNPGSPFYDNTIQDWIEGNYYPLHFPKSQHELTFEPLSKQYFK